MWSDPVMVNFRFAGPSITFFLPSSAVTVKPLSGLPLPSSTPTPASYLTPLAPHGEKNVFWLSWFRCHMPLYISFTAPLPFTSLYLSSVGAVPPTLKTTFRNFSPLLSLICFRFLRVMCALHYIISVYTDIHMI